MSALFMAILLGLAACTGNSLPDSARDALLSYWDSLPSDPGIEHRIVRVWEGSTGAGLPDSDATPSEIWCVEAEMLSGEDPALDGSRTVWIITHDRGDARWSAALLASLSSTWPYEACSSGAVD